MAKKPKTTSNSVEGEHIFPATQLTPLAVRWKELSSDGRHKEAMVVLEQIIEGSTNMFERLAQFENYHTTVQLPLLVSAAQERVVKWLKKWDFKKGRLFSWFSKCAKNAFRSELSKENNFRRHNHVTSDNLEVFYGAVDHEVDKRDLAQEFLNKLQHMTCRWGDPQEIAAIRYLVECIVDDASDKQGAIRGAAYACGISLELSKFFYGWTVAALRHELYDRVYVPFTEEDLFRAAMSYEHIVDLLDYVDWETCKKILTRWQNMRIKFPPLAFYAKLHQNYALYREIESSDLDPDAIAELAKRRKRTVRAAQEIYNDMMSILNPKRTGEYEIYDSTADI